KGDAGLHSPNTGYESRLAHSHQERAGLRGQPEIDGWTREFVRRDAYDCVTLACKHEALIECCRRAVKAPLPERLTDHCGARPGLTLFGGRKVAAQLRRSLEQLEVARCDTACRQPFSFRSAGICHILRVKSRDGFESPIHSIPVFEASGRDQSFTSGLGAS